MHFCITERVWVVVMMVAIAYAFVTLVARYVRGRRAFNDALEIYRRSQGEW